MRRPRRGVRPFCELLPDRCLPAGLTVAQLTHAYGLDAIEFTTTGGDTVVGDGFGETIALIEAYHDPSLGSDVHVFDQANGLFDPSLTVVGSAGGKINPDWVAEESLDVEWAHAIAPGATILVVEAQSDSLSDLMKAVNVARNTPGVASISMSWGFDESKAEMAFDPIFRTPAGHQGVTFVAASGDDGTAAGPQYPASSPSVLAVGGTTLLTVASGDYLEEVAWYGSGGGYSQVEAEPSYQRSIQQTDHRSTPDVAFDGDPNTGVALYETAPGSTLGSWITVGGTSLGSPAWAALIAIADQGRALQGKDSLNGPSQALPAIYHLSASDFHHVATPFPSSPWGGGVNPVGYDPYGGTFPHVRGRSVAMSSTGPMRANISTGLGTPVVPRLVFDLVASSMSRGSATAGMCARLDPASSTMVAAFKSYEGFGFGISQAGRVV